MRATLTLVLCFAGMAAAAPAPKAPPVPAVTKEHIAASQNNLKQIGLGIVNCSDTNNGNMPTNILDKNGKPILSLACGHSPLHRARPPVQAIQTR